MKRMIHQSDCQIHGVDFDENGILERGDCTCLIKDVIDALYAEGERRAKEISLGIAGYRGSGNAFDLVADWMVEDAL